MPLMLQKFIKMGQHCMTYKYMFQNYCCIENKKLLESRSIWWGFYMVLFLVCT